MSYQHLLAPPRAGEGFAFATGRYDTALVKHEHQGLRRCSLTYSHIPQFLSVFQPALFVAKFTNRAYDSSRTSPFKRWLNQHVLIPH